jgi:hypothetical protein
VSTLSSDIEEFIGLHTQFKKQQLTPEEEARYRALKAKVQAKLNAPLPVNDGGKSSESPTTRPALRL